MIAVRCERRPCGNTTTDPSGECHQHRGKTSAPQQAVAIAPPTLGETLSLVADVTQAQQDFHDAVEDTLKDAEFEGSEMSRDDIAYDLISSMQSLWTLDVAEDVSQREFGYIVADVKSRRIQEDKAQAQAAYEAAHAEDIAREQRRESGLKKAAATRAANERAAAEAERAKVQQDTCMACFTIHPPNACIYD